MAGAGLQCSFVNAIDWSAFYYREKAALGVGA
jgi:hypothetical protein